MDRWAAGGRIRPHYGKDEGIGGPPAPALGQRQWYSWQWVSSLAVDDGLNAAPPTLHRRRGIRLDLQLAVRIERQCFLKGERQCYHPYLA